MSKTFNKNLIVYVKPYLNPAFLLCVIVLGATAGSISFTKKQLGMILKKEPIPLKTPLDQLDENGLGPYKVVIKKEIKDEEVIKSLGTKDYIQWILEDTETDQQSNSRNCMLFITYYAQPDVVVHIPDECYMGGGNQRLASESVLFELAISSENTKDQGETAADELKVPGKYVVFSETSSNIWQSQSKFAIFYTFNVNGQYKGNREDTRFVLNKNIRGKHSYFAKIEWQFSNTRFGKKVYPDKIEGIEASKKLLSVILPILEHRHWPEWNK